MQQDAPPTKRRTLPKLTLDTMADYLDAVAQMVYAGEVAVERGDRLITCATTLVYSQTQVPRPGLKV